jgi:hypothetical protein
MDARSLNDDAGTERTSPHAPPRRASTDRAEAHRSDGFLLDLNTWKRPTCARRVDAETALVSFPLHSRASEQ